MLARMTCYLLGDSLYMYNSTGFYLHRLDITVWFLSEGRLQWLVNKIEVHFCILAKVETVKGLGWAGIATVYN